MRVDPESVALVALLRLGRRSWVEYGKLVERAGSAAEVLERELGTHGSQTTLLPADPVPLLNRARAEVEGWRADGIVLSTVLDERYPRSLRSVDDRPPLLFLAGSLEPRDERSIAVIGAREASPEGLKLSSAFAAEFVAAGYTVISGLAAGVDTAAHEAALRQGGRTLAVIGTGLSHSYPPQNAGLQQRIAERSAVVSQFWPESPPTRASFPRRNAVMSGLSRGSVLVEASDRSGARVQARLALAHGRPVFLLRRLLDQLWARELSARSGVHVVDSAAHVIGLIDSRSAEGAQADTTADTPSRPPTRSSCPP
jgi:DNA processing protein